MRTLRIERSSRSEPHLDEEAALSRTILERSASGSWVGIMLRTLGLAATATLVALSVVAQPWTPAAPTPPPFVPTKPAELRAKARAQAKPEARKAAVAVEAKAAVLAGAKTRPAGAEKPAHENAAAGQVEPLLPIRAGTARARVEARAEVAQATMDGTERKAKQVKLERATKPNTAEIETRNRAWDAKLKTTMGGICRGC